MGLMTELFVATPERAATYDAHSEGRFEHVKLGRLTHLEFEMLWAILEGKAWAPKTHALREIRSTDSQWVFEFPARFLGILPSLSDAAKASAAAAWADTEELADASPADLAPIIESLIALSRSAAESGQGVFVWISL
jgi:hypothetical protein